MTTSLEEELSDSEVLRNGVHVLTATLLMVTAGASLRLGLGPGVLNLLLVTGFGALYFAGSAYVDNWTETARGAWLAMLTLVWISDLFVAPVAIYLVFALYFVYLQIYDDFRGVLAVIVATALAIAVQIPHGLTLGGIMGPAVSAVVTIAIFFAFRTLARVNSERAELIDELMATRSQLAETERNAGVSEERQRIAHEIHDTLAQGLSSIQMLLHAVDRDIAALSPQGAADEQEHQRAVDKAHGRIELARKTAAENLQEARAMIAALQPAGLQQTSLQGALERMADGFAGAGEMDIEVDIEGEHYQLPMKVEAAVLRIAQGAVGNAAKHSKASKARVTVTYEPEKVRLDVVDNGVGFEPSVLAERPSGLGHIGLDAMKRRAAELGGTLTVESEPGRGTAVAVVVPVENPTR